MRDEVAAAEVVEQLAPRVLGRSLGRRNRRDGRDRSGLRVDFTYDECAPAVALEVTGIHAPQDRQLWGEIDKRLEPQLMRLAVVEKLGTWLIVLDATANVRRLLAEVPDLMRSGLSFRPGEYTSDDLLAVPREEATASVARHQHFQSLGLVALERQGMVEDGVRCMAFGTEGELVGFEERIAAAISDNSRKLDETGDRERHLAIFVYDFRASRLVERTGLPTLPEEVDYVWVMHTWPRERGKPEVWIGRRGTSSWRREIWSALDPQ
jgi:hypothetical protein